jgi:hypothetical protein
MKLAPLFGLFGLAITASPALAQSGENSEHRVYTAPDSISCTEASEKVRSPEFATMVPADVDIYMIRYRQCLTAAWNTSHPEDPQVLLATYDPDPEHGGVLFNSISIRDAQNVTAACKVAASVIGGQEFGDNAVTYALSGAIGNYACDSYLQAAVRNDPLLILLPNYIPAFQLQRDVWNEIRRTTSRIPGRDIGGFIPGTRIPLIVVAPGVALAIASAQPIENVRRESERAIQNAGRETGRAAGNVARETQRAGRKACRVVFHHC